MADFGLGQREKIGEVGLPIYGFGIALQMKVRCVRQTKGRREDDEIIWIGEVGHRHSVNYLF